MPTIFAANESRVMIGPDVVEGVKSVNYRYHQARQNVYALGSAERIGVVSGARTVEGQITVASTVSLLDGRLNDEPFEIIAELKHGTTSLTVTFQECLVTEKQFSLGQGGHGEATYFFTATRVTEGA